MTHSRHSARERAVEIRDRLIGNTLAYIAREKLTPEGAVMAALRMGAEAALLEATPLSEPAPAERIEEAYQRGHEDGYWNGKTTDMSPAQAAAFMASYRSRCPGCIVSSASEVQP